MTAQACEQIVYLRKQYSMHSLPIEPYFAPQPDRPKFIRLSTDCWRGYFGKWEIKGDKLFLIEFNGFAKDFKEINLNTLFPNQDKVFASWYTGVIEIVSGKLIEYIHVGFESVYESSIFLEFKEGFLIKKVVVNNEKSRNSKSDSNDLFFKYFSDEVED
jgi:hypothetical protein